MSYVGWNNSPLYFACAVVMGVVIASFFGKLWMIASILLEEWIENMKVAYICKQIRRH